MHRAVKACFLVHSWGEHQLVHLRSFTVREQAALLVVWYPMAPVGMTVVVVWYVQRL